MNQLVLGVVLLGTALPVAVGLVYGLGLLFALVLVQILTQVQDPPTVFLQTEQHRCVYPLKHAMTRIKTSLLPESVVNM